jgi:electron transfer flavoprotein-quinone oxidoreductase
MSDDQVRVDAIVVGAGPAGLVAALTMARQGLEVVVVERGESAGSKNLGGLLYGTVLEDLLPGFHKDAPVERAVVRRRVCYLGKGDQFHLDFGREAWGQEPYNHTWTVHRSAFDRWLAGKVEEEGVGLVEGMLVEDLLYEGEGPARKACGVKLAGDEVFHADLVILADGAHSLVTKKARRELGIEGPAPQHFALGVKETISLPAKVIEDRFALDENTGAAFDYIGAPFEGLIGGGFIYTQKETVSIGMAARIDTLKDAGLEPPEVMERFRSHPEIRHLLKGGELLEYGAHMIPEGGFDSLAPFCGNGVMIAGDAAGLVNMSLYKEGTNHAMFSGKLAGECAVKAKAAGDFSRQGLSAYESGMLASAAVADLKKYRELPRLMEELPEVLNQYPEKLARLLADYFTISSEPKSVTQARARQDFFNGLSKLKLARDLFKARKLL